MCLINEEEKVIVMPQQKVSLGKVKNISRRLTRETRIFIDVFALSAKSALIRG
jgi:hypothetical protein